MCNIFKTLYFLLDIILVQFNKPLKLQKQKKILKEGDETICL